MSLSNSISVISVCSGVGVMIDFWIRKSGQDKVRTWLELWWYRFSYVRLKHFGYEEAVFAVEMIDRFAGKKLFSRRRFKATAYVAAWAFCFGILTPAIILFYQKEEFFILFTKIILGFGLSIIFFALSISITRFGTLQASTALKKFPVLNFLPLLLLLLLQYILFSCITPFIGDLFAFLTSLWVLYDDQLVFPIDPSITHELSYLFHLYFLDPWILDPRYQYYKFSVAFRFDELNSHIPRIFYINEPECCMYEDGGRYANLFPNKADYAMMFVSNVGRFLLTLVFILSYILKPVHSFLLGLWQRIIESEEPIFTLVLGGGAAVMEGVLVLIRYL